MALKIPTLVLDAVVLQILDRGELYGYLISKEIQEITHISDSTTYPVLRRLEKAELLETHTVIFEERSRKYYKITDQGRVRLKELKQDWHEFATQINSILGE
ncbi:PadR family transcriptional regulator [Convivina intestini]|uniref:PadR family transcriptional regulator PadR n=1 Tax=Convivina intestini TaxID=1505726 RepID=A0A2U1DFD8_9LACO|nr:PadR family transcriptional regulator [Convivina intestini]PVY86262.1 PadR family transcriptional regulator PadR [Convivina intestini]CAH1851157.1 hypothetical protein R077811_00236 [Convivina intestini]CAH1851801.1 hypothetical protein R078131_00345 [Convivina intestini]SDB81970.1 PadR family transcriptional regulator, regulatory protein PadR [Leuconostocaceae bacterium R-53105]